MKGISRRRFLHDSLMGLGAVSLGNFAIPSSGHAQNNDLKALVVIQLSGGLDPLLAFPHTGDEASMSQIRGEYARIPTAGLTELAAGLAVHPGLQSLALGYGNSFKVVMQTGNAFSKAASRSHDIASHYMVTGGFGNLNNRLGWTGRLFDNGVGLEGFGGHSAYFNCEECDSPPFTTSDYESFDPVKEYFSSDVRNGVSQGGIRNSKHVDQVLRNLNQHTPQREVSEAEDRFRRAQKTMFQAVDSIKDVLDVRYSTPLSAGYASLPSPQFAQKFRNIAQRLNFMKINGQGGKIVFVMSLGGFDIHDRWRTVGDSLMVNLGSCLKHFRDDLKAAGLDNNVVTFCSTEFGRTIAGNGTGTDHGIGYTAFLTGGNVAGGVYGRIIPPAELKNLISTNANAWPREVSHERLVTELLEKHLGVAGKLAYPDPLYQQIPKYSDLNLLKV